ncbi:hypothetical protein BGZ47_008966 [Haplosporangium gracile]|nr:hypothetical protein BGZ47_008966 [Haplosporangium gracile]
MYKLNATQRECYCPLSWNNFWLKYTCVPSGACTDKELESSTNHLYSFRFKFCSNWTGEFIPEGAEEATSTTSTSLPTRTGNGGGTVVAGSSLVSVVAAGAALAIVSTFGLFL